MWCSALSDTYIVLFEQRLWGVSIAQMVEVTDSAVLGGFVAVMSSNSAGVINIFQHLPT